MASEAIALANQVDKTLHGYHVQAEAWWNETQRFMASIRDEVKANHHGANNSRQVLYGRIDEVDLRLSNKIDAAVKDIDNKLDQTATKINTDLYAVKTGINERVWRIITIVGGTAFAILLGIVGWLLNKLVVVIGAQ